MMHYPPRSTFGWLTLCKLSLPFNLPCSMILSAAILILGSTATRADVEDVRVMDDHWELELIAQQPEIVTPIGIAFDPHGRLLVIESHTHQRRNEYVGPAADRIRMLEDRDGDGRLDHWSTYHEGLRLAMNLVAYGDAVYVVTTEALVRLRDTDGDGSADEQTEIVRLECSENKTHSGLAGLSIVDEDTLYLGLGKNTGKPYRVVGSDGTVFTGEGDGGSVFRCRTDGTRLERIAGGLWNPWGMCIDPFGRLFCTENDPDSSPPCQLLHIVPGGDYGFEMRFGRDGQHPLQSFNGQLPGTLGMVCNIGESPCSILPYRGSLWIASWVDHTIRQYQLAPRGASFRATRETVVQGSTDFRPVGLAEAPDGSLYISDWVNRSYPIHGEGRLWRLSRKDSSKSGLKFPALNNAEKHAERLRLQPELSALRSTDPYLRQAAVYGFATRDKLSDLHWQDLTDAQQRLGLLEAMQWSGDVPDAEGFRAALGDPHTAIKVFTTRWIAKLQLREYQDDIRQLLDDPDIDIQSYLVYLSAADLLGRGTLPIGSRIHEEVLVEEFLLNKRPPSVQAFLLRMMSPDHPSLTPILLGNLLKSDNTELRLEALRTISQQNRPERFATLAEIASKETYDESIRLEAIAGLAAAAEEHHPLLRSLAQSGHASIRREAARSLRLGGVVTPTIELKPPATDIDAWLSLVEQSGDSDAGKRLFFSSAGPLCARCHRFDGRGGNLAPDLTQIGQQQSRRRILTSILQPSDEIPNRYIPWILLTDQGKAYTGLWTKSRGTDGMEEYYDAEGKLFSLPTHTIEEREQSSVSIMPDGLDKLLTIDDLRDLLAMLMSSSHSNPPSDIPHK